MSDTHYGWFVVPVVESEGRIGPKHVMGGSGIAGHCSGRTLSADEFAEEGYGDVVDEHDEADRWRVVVAWAHGSAGRDTLESIGDEADVVTLERFDADVRELLPDVAGDWRPTPAIENGENIGRPDETGPDAGQR